MPSGNPRRRIDGRRLIPALGSRDDGSASGTAPLLPTTIEIARVAVRIAIDDAALARDVAARYSRFLRARDPDLTLSLRVRASDSPPQDDVVTVEPRDAGTYRLARSDFDCDLDVPRGRASATVARSIYTVDSLLRVAFTLILAPQQGVLLHSSGLVQDGRAYIFYGPSGAGKTTTASRGGSARLLSDEVVAVRRDGGSYRAFGTPFAGDFGVSGEDVSAPIAGLMRLGRPPGPALSRQSPSAAVRSLLRCVLYFGGSEQDADLLLSTCIDLEAAIPCHDLRLRLERPLWEQLHELG